MLKVVNTVQFSGGLREAAGFFHAAWPGLAESRTAITAMANRAGFTASRPLDLLRVYNRMT